PADVDARCQHEPVVRQLRAVGERDRSRRRVDGGRARAGDRDAVSSDALVSELLGGELAQAADHRVAERAGGERPVRLDQRHDDARVELAKRAGTACPREATADDHDAGPGRLGAGSTGSESDRGGRRDAQLEKMSAGRLHRCAAYQAAIAWISASVNPLAMRSITVPARAPERKSCMALMISARSRPASRVTGDGPRAAEG